MPTIAYGEIPIYGERFLCKLYDMAQGIIERRFDRTGVFDALGKKAFEDQTKRQAIDDIVQYLKKKEWITTFENSDDVRLTDSGLTKCKEVCPTNKL